MRRRRACALGVATLLAVLGSLQLAGCKVTVDDLEKWRNRPRSEDKFVEWMLDPEATPDVRAKAVEMLFEQWNYEGAQQLPRVGDLPPEARDQAIIDALPHLHELLQGARFSLGGEAMGRLRPVQVRDGAMMLLQATDDPTTRAAILDQVVVPWLREHYRPCITSTGRHPNSRILTTVGPERGLPTVVSYIRDGEMDDIICQNSYLGEVEWRARTSEELATAFTERWNANPPETAEGQRQFVAAMVTVPNSRVLKNWIFTQLLETDDPLLPDVVDAFLAYAEPMTDATDAERYAAMIQKFDGFMRWIGFQNVLRLRGTDGLTQALNAIPDAGIWGRWGGAVVPDGLKRAANWVCGRPQITEAADTARQVFEAQLVNNNLVARAIAIECLRDVGSAESIEPLRGQLELNAIIPSWAPPSAGEPTGEEPTGEEPEEGEDTTTVGELAAEVIAAIEARLAAETE